MKKLILIKFGGSLITDKNRINSARLDLINKLSQQIKEVVKKKNDLSIMIATGAGGFGHPMAEKYKTDLSAGFLEIKKAVKVINQLVVDSLKKKGIKAIGIEPSKISEYEDGKMVSLSYGFIVSLLEKDIIPVFHADLVKDLTRGVSILSMDRFLVDTAIIFKKEGFEVEKVIFCGTTDGVLDNNKSVIGRINKKNISSVQKYFFDNKQIDTSGGMKGKVGECMRLLDKKIPGIIINGQNENNLTKTILRSETDGTLIAE